MGCRCIECPVWLRIVYGALMMGILFAGYVVASGYATTIYGIYGFYSHMIVFICTIFGALFSPILVTHVLGIKWTLMTGAGTYVIYLLAYCLDHVPLFLVMSAVNGFGAGIFRSQQNTWITSMPIHTARGFVRSANHTPIKSSFHQDGDMAWYLGLFNSVFGLYGIIGAVIALVVFSYEFSNAVLMWTMTGMAFGAFLAMIFMEDPLTTRDDTFNLEVYKGFLLDGHLWLLAPMVFFQAYGMVYSYEVLPLMYAGNSYWIALNFLVYSVVYCVVSYMVGFLSRWIQPIIWVAFMTILSLTFGVYLAILHIYAPPHTITDLLAWPYAVYLLFAILCAMNDSIVLFCVVYILAENYSNHMIYGYHRALFSIFAAFIAAVSPYMPWWFPSLIFIGSAVSMCVGYWWFYYLRVLSAPLIMDETKPLLPV